MKKFVLAFILLFSAPIILFGQKDRSREILKSSLRKMSGGKQLSGFELKKTFESLGQTPANLLQPNPIWTFMEEYLKSAPDSIKKQMEIGMKTAKESLYNSMTDTGNIELLQVDIKSGRIAVSRISQNSLRQSQDTSRNVYDRTQVAMADFLKDNPVGFLQIMTSDTTELHYTGSTLLNGAEHHIIQAKKSGEWIDIFVDKESGLITQISYSFVDKDPLIGSEPEHYKIYSWYSNYRQTSGFLLPQVNEEIDTRIEFTTKKRLDWMRINTSFPEHTFKPEPAYEEKVRFSSVQLSDSLFVIRELGRYIESRSLVRITPQGQLDCFMEPINHNAIAEKFVKTLAYEFQGRSLRNVFCSRNVSSASSFAAFFNANAKVFAPKGAGIMSEESQNQYNKAEDSTWKARKAEGVLITFQQSLVQDDVKVFIINPDLKEGWEQRNVLYYLPDKKLVFYHSINYQGRGDSDQASQNEKWLYAFLSERKLEVDDLIVTDSFVDNAPLQVTYADFEKKIK